MTKHALLLVALAACTDEHDLGSTYAPRVARWAVAFPANPTGEVANVAIDPAGDVVAVGTFRGVVDFGHTTLTSSSNDSDDTWISKRAGTDGSELWTIGLHATNFELADMAVDAAGDVYVAGSYGDSLQLGPFTLSAPSEGDAFVAKLTPDGTFAWAHDLPRTGVTDHYVRHLAVSPDGRAYLAGRFEGEIDFPTGPVTSTTNPCQGDADFGCFLAGFDADGTLAWGEPEPLGGPTAIAGNDGFVLVVVPQSSMTFGGTSIDLTHEGDLVVANVASDGTITSVHPVGQPGVIEGDVGVVSTSNGIVISATPQTDGSPPSDLLVDAAGTQQWSAGPIAGDIQQGPFATAGGNIYTAGHIVDGSVDFGDGSHAGSLYLTTRTADGTLSGVDTYGDPGGVDSFATIAATGDGTLAFGANVGASLDFGSGPVGDGVMVIGMLPP